MNQLKNWEKTTQKLADYFIKKYFGKDASDIYWVADEIGGVLCVNDYFFNLDDIVNFIKYRYGVEKMFEYYNYKLEKQINNAEYIVNIKNWLKIKKL